MYADTFRNGSYLSTTFLLTYHGSNSSTFTFDSSPIYLGNYSFDFYINDPYQAMPQFICNATLEYHDPNQNPSNPKPPPKPTPTSPFEINGPILAMIGLASSITVVGVTVFVGNRVKKRRSRKIIEPEQESSAREIIKEVKKVSFNEWD